MKESPKDHPKEENHPLLMLFMEEGQRPSKKRGLFFDKTRFRGITGGASSVVSQWPSQVSSFFLTAIIGGSVIFFLVLLIVATSVDQRYLLPRCTHREEKGAGSQMTPTAVYLVHDDRPWQQRQLDAVHRIARNYPGCRIELTILYNPRRYGDGNATDKMESIRFNLTYGNVTHVINEPHHIRQKRELLERIMENMKPIDHNETASTPLPPQQTTTPSNEFNILIGSKNILTKFFNLGKLKHRPSGFMISEPKIRNLQDLADRHPSITIRVVSCSSFFMFSPLYVAWHDLNARTLLFAARVLRLWDNGGISFELPDLSKESVARYAKGIASNSQGNSSPMEEQARLDHFINMDYDTFQRLPAGVVTADDEGVHMETRVPCHAFFAELLMNLKLANNRTSAAQLIRKTLRTFCETGAVDEKYCIAHTDPM